MSEALSPGAEEYLSWLAVEKGRSRNTLVAYRHDLVGFEAWAQADELDTTNNSRPRFAIGQDPGGDWLLIAY